MQLKGNTKEENSRPVADLRPPNRITLVARVLGPDEKFRILIMFMHGMVINMSCSCITNEIVIAFSSKQQLKRI